MVGAPLVPWLSESVVADVAALRLEDGSAATRRAPGGVGASRLSSHAETILVFGLADNGWSDRSLLWLATSLILQPPEAFQTLWDRFWLNMSPIRAIWTWFEPIFMIFFNKLAFSNLQTCIFAV